MESVILYNKLKIFRDGRIERKYKSGIWRVVKNVANTSGGYNRVRVDGKMWMRHRLVVAAFNPVFDINNPEHQVDHIDGNKLNNAFSNLRVVTQQGNLFNNPNAKGYCWNKRAGKWHAYINVDGKQKFLGYFDTEEEARAAYIAAKEVHHVIQEVC
tara:strand:- start:52 stop:519 length:468 start_codon:yes stop_codon:yes gene_type:complete